jgi:PAS domain S-box-containing protein
LPRLRQKLSLLILGQKGGQNRIQIIKLLKERPYNTNQLSELLNLNYRTVKHHIDIFVKNDIVSSSSTGSYGEIYFLTPEMEGSMNIFDDIESKFTSSRKLNDFTYSPEFFKKVMEETNDAVIILDSDGKIFFCNNSAEKLLGYKRDDVIGESIQLFTDGDTETELISKASEGDGISAHETKMMTGTGRSIDVDVSISAIYDDKTIIGYSILSRNMTERKLAEERQKLTINLLERLNQAGAGKELIKDILELVKSYTGFEAVGIRLKDEPDYPYFITKGFPSHFVEAEKYLCSYGNDGNLIHDDDNLPVLECMCGRVIRGYTDPSKDFFTENGSFWTNDTDELLESTRQDDLGGPTRNRCNQEGYRSVALIPLKDRNDVIGLLQLNDRRMNMFTPDIIDFFEDIGSSIGIAFNRMKMEESLKISS